MDEKQQERADRWKDWMGLLVGVIALVTALAAWRAAVAARTAGIEDYYALTAALNRAQAETLNTSSALEHLTAFTQFAINDELQTQLLNTDTTAKSEEEQAVLAEQLDQASRLAATNRNFFPARYAAKDGTYAVPREIAESTAESERRQDLDPQPHLETSGKMDAKTFAYIQIVIVLSVALLAFTIAGALHYSRTVLRWTAAGAGILCLLVSVGAMFMIEFMQG